MGSRAEIVKEGARGGVAGLSGSMAKMRVHVSVSLSLS